MRHEFALVFCYGPAVPGSFLEKERRTGKEARQEGVLK